MGKLGYVFIAPLIAASLAGCSSANIEQVRAQTLLLCSFVPLAATIADIIDASSMRVQTAQQIAAAICATVAQQPPSPSRVVTVNVNGMLVSGTFVQ